MINGEIRLYPIKFLKLKTYHRDVNDKSYLNRKK